MDKDVRKKDHLDSSENIDVSRRNLLRTAGKAAWVAPTLTFLALNTSLAAAGSVTGPPCGGGSPFSEPCPDSYSGTTSSRRPRRRNGNG